MRTGFRTYSHMYDKIYIYIYIYINLKMYLMIDVSVAYIFHLLVSTPIIGRKTVSDAQCMPTVSSDEG